eukprot:s2655_g3.t1
MAPSAGVTLCLCPELQRNALGEVLRTGAEGRVTLDLTKLEDFDAAPLPWALIQADFNYVSQWSVASAEDPLAPLGSRTSAVLCFAGSAVDLEKVLEELKRWWLSVSRHCPGARLFLVLTGQKAASLNAKSAELLAEVLVSLGWNTVEVRTPEQAAMYAINCAEAVVKSRGRTLPSRFKVQGVRCQTVPKDPDDRLANTWVSQLMQVQGMSEEMAKVVAERFSSPFAMMEAISVAAQSAPEEETPVEGEKKPCVRYEQCEDAHHTGTAEDLRRCRKDGKVRCKGCRQDQKRKEDAVGTRGLDLAAHFRSKQLQQRHLPAVEVVVSSPSDDDIKETEDATKPVDFAIDPAAPLKIEEESTTDVPNTSPSSPSSNAAKKKPKKREPLGKGVKCLHIGCDVCPRWFVVDQVLFDHWCNEKFTCCMVGESCSRKETHTALVACKGVPQMLSRYGRPVRKADSRHLKTCYLTLLQEADIYFYQNPAPELLPHAPKGESLGTPAPAPESGDRPRSPKKKKDKPTKEEKAAKKTAKDREKSAERKERKKHRREEDPPDPAPLKPVKEEAEEAARGSQDLEKEEDREEKPLQGGGQASSLPADDVPKVRVQRLSSEEPAGRVERAPRARASPGGRGLRRPAVAEVDPAAGFEGAFEVVRAAKLQPASLLEAGRIWFTEVVYWKEVTQCVGVCKGLQKTGGEWWVDLQVEGTRSEHLLRYLSGVPGRQIRGHLCTDECSQETSGDDFLHIKLVKKLKDTEEEEWMRNLLGAGRDPADELAELRDEAEGDIKDADRREGKKTKKEEKKEKEKKKEKKRERSTSPAAAAKPGGRDLKAILGGSGLDPDPKRRKKMLKRAKRIIKKKKKKKGSSTTSRSSGSRSSSSGASTSEVQAADIFGQTRTAKRIAKLCPGVLTASSVASVQEQLLNAQGQMWELDRRELPPLFMQYFRGHLSQGMTPPMKREAVHVSYCLDLGLTGRIPQLLDVLAQRLKALEGQAAGKHWSVTAQFEVVPEEQGSVATQQEIEAAAREAREVGRLKAQAGRPFGASSTFDKGEDWRRDSYKGKGQKGEGKGKDGKKEQKGDNRDWRKERDDKEKNKGK